MTNKLVNTINVYRLIESEVELAESNLKKLKADLFHAEQNVLEAFADQDEVDRLDIGGVAYKPDYSPKLKIVSAPEGQKYNPHSDAVAQYVEQIAPHLVTPTLHWAKRDSFLRETLANDEGGFDIPDELAEHVELFTAPSLSKRKA